MTAKKGKILFFVNVDWFFISHRLPLAKAAKENGYEVHLITKITNRRSELKKNGIIVHNIELTRSSREVLSSLRIIYQVYRILLKVRPRVIHLVTIKPVLLGGLAARIAGINKVIFSISGMGYVYTNENFLNNLNKFFLSYLYKLSFKQKEKKVIFQNKYDRSLISKLVNLDSTETILIKGSGVNLIQYNYRPLPEGVPIVLMASRMLKDKGVLEFVESAKRLKHLNSRFVLVGEPDNQNIASLKEDQLVEWHKEGIIEYWGHKTDMNDILSMASIVVLPSYREGMPKVLLEASAIGRPIVTTDVPGCRDAIINNITGILVPPKNIEKLSETIKFLLGNKELMNKMSIQSRKHAESNYDIKEVIETHLMLYSS